MQRIFLNRVLVVLALVGVVALGGDSAGGSLLGQGDPLLDLGRSSGPLQDQKDPLQDQEGPLQDQKGPLLPRSSSAPPLIRQPSLFENSVMPPQGPMSHDEYVQAVQSQPAHADASPTVSAAEKMTKFSIHVEALLIALGVEAVRAITIYKMMQEAQDLEFFSNDLKRKAQQLEDLATTQRKESERLRRDTVVSQVRHTMGLVTADMVQARKQLEDLRSKKGRLVLSQAVPVTMVEERGEGGALSRGSSLAQHDFFESTGPHGWLRSEEGGVTALLDAASTAEGLSLARPSGALGSEGADLFGAALESRAPSSRGRGPSPARSKRSSVASSAEARTGGSSLATPAPGSGTNIGNLLESALPVTSPDEEAEFVGPSASKRMLPSRRKDKTRGTSRIQRVEPADIDLTNSGDSQLTTEPSVDVLGTPDEGSSPLAASLFPAEGSSLRLATPSRASPTPTGKPPVPRPRREPGHKSDLADASDNAAGDGGDQTTTGHFRSRRKQSATSSAPSAATLPARRRGRGSFASSPDLMETAPPGRTPSNRRRATEIATTPATPSSPFIQVDLLSGLGDSVVSGDATQLLGGIVGARVPTRAPSGTGITDVAAGMATTPSSGASSGSDNAGLPPLEEVLGAPRRGSSAASAAKQMSGGISGPGGTPSPVT